MVASSPVITHLGTCVVIELEAGVYLQVLSWYSFPQCEGKENEPIPAVNCRLIFWSNDAELYAIKSFQYMYALGSSSRSFHQNNCWCCLHLHGKRAVVLVVGYPTASFNCSRWLTPHQLFLNFLNRKRKYGYVKWHSDWFIFWFKFYA